MEFKRHAGIYTFTHEQLLRSSPKDVWAFFSDPGNLAKLSPEEIHFRITSPPQTKAYPGQIITYRIALFPWARFNWVTEITQVTEERYFIDEQRFGPYAMWHHEHIFEPHQEGVLMKDKISFKLPLGPLGHLAFRLFVRKKLLAIFTYRAHTAASLFSQTSSAFD